MKKIPKNLYHVTHYINIKSIMKEGLIPNKGLGLLLDIEGEKLLDSLVKIYMFGSMEDVDIFLNRLLKYNIRCNINDMCVLVLDPTYIINIHLTNNTILNNILKTDDKVEYYTLYDIPKKAIIKSMTYKEFSNVYCK